jgi:peptidylprolyl isomerase
MFDKSSSLDGQYTIWGEVIEGMDYVDLIKKGSSMSNGVVKDPDEIVSLRVAADVVS